MILLDVILTNESNKNLFSKSFKKLILIIKLINYLEYPEEIKYKLEIILNGLKRVSDNIETKINSSYNNRILNIIKSTNN
jgi:hypothetical protein